MLDFFAQSAENKMNSDLTIYQPSDESIVVYKSNDGVVQLEVQLANETVWLTLSQLAMLFDRDKSVISRHLRNIYAEGELTREATVAKNATVQDESGRMVARQLGASLKDLGKKLFAFSKLEIPTETILQIK